jgi:hypothetical protein
MLVSPEPPTGNPTPIPWSRAVPVRPDELVLFYVGGYRQCYALDHFDIEVTEEDIVITLFEGKRPAATGINCTSGGEEKAVLVPVPSLIKDRQILDGATP